jgi:hypothetical protein
VDARTRVPSAYLATVYGATAAERVQQQQHKPIELGALQMLYSGMSVPRAHDAAHLPAPSEAAASGDALDVVQAAVRGSCYFFSGSGDFDCCTSPLNTNGAFARRLGQLIYNPHYQPRGEGLIPAPSHTWVEVTRWPNRCLPKLMSTANGRGKATLCDGRIDNQSYGVWFFAAGGSGVWLNVGRTLFGPSRSRTARYLCAAAPAYARRCLHDPNGVRDDWWCSAALHAGYDSIHFFSGSSYVRHASGARRTVKVGH